jgi:hypothetical protein
MFPKYIYALGKFLIKMNAEPYLSMNDMCNC